MTAPALDAAALLAGPGGRRLCLELAEPLNPDVRFAAFHASRSTSDGTLRQNLLDALGATDPAAIASWSDPLAFADAMDVCVTWWSAPSYPSSLPSTTRPLPGVGSIKLLWEEDSAGEPNAAIWSLAATRAPRVWEVHQPSDWVALVARYPLDVTGARRYDWYRVSGRLGMWLIPDWPAVAADWDAVHVSVTGYLTTATRALPLPGDDATDAATMLAGWDPDQTWWLTDVLRQAGPSEHWVRVDEDWQRAG